jgi:hypothetical protein
MTCPCSKRAICFFVTRSSARMAVTAIAGCALRASQSLFIFRIGQRAWRQRAYTICITSRPSMKQIGPGEGEIAAWEIASGCARYHAAWVLNLGGFGAGLVVAPRRLFRAFLRGRRAKTNLYKSGFDESRLNDITVGMLRDQLGSRAAFPSAGATDVGLFLVWCILSVFAWLPLPLLTVILFWLIMGAKF